MKAAQIQQIAEADTASEDFAHAGLPSMSARRRAVREGAWAKWARPSFLYVMYALLLWSIPVGLLAAVRPAAAEAIVRTMAAYFSGIPEPLYALFGTGYLGYVAARQWGKVKDASR